MTKLILALSTLLICPQAFPWGDTGHSIVGAIAEQMVEPQTKDYIRGLMGLEPLSDSAIFPDHVRDDIRFGHQEKNPDLRAADIHDFADYHFCEIPTGFTYDTRPVKSTKDCYGAITNSIKILKDNNYSREEKMIALRYLAHVVGDIHQPLHVGNGFDIGANLCKVRTWKNQNYPINFHSFWDNDLVEFLGQTYGDKNANPPRMPALYLKDYVANMQRVHPEMFSQSAKQTYGKGTVKDWLQESQQIRENGLYPDPEGGSQSEIYKHRKYCGWFSDQLHSVFGPGSPIPGKIPLSDIPVLDEETYAKPYAKVAESQIIKAGLRLAVILDDIARQVGRSSPKIDDSVQEAILKAVQDAFRASN